MTDQKISDRLESKIAIASGDWFSALVESTKRVEEWEISKFELSHKPSGLRLWIASGWGWHSWRAGVIAFELRPLEESCELLKKAEEEYGSSYYTDKLHRAVRRRAQLTFALEYHRERSIKPEKESR